MGEQYSSDRENRDRTPFFEKLEEGNTVFLFAFGGPGHELEYMLNLEGFFDGDDPMGIAPYAIIAQALMKKIGEEWTVLNRGNRLEIYKKGNPGVRNDDMIRAEVRAAIQEKASELETYKKPEINLRKRKKQ
jgi:hypothetical protein